MTDTSLTIDRLTIEIHDDEAALYGSLSIPMDKEGLATIEAVLPHLEAIRDKLRNLAGKGALPDKVERVLPDEVGNPFSPSN